MSSALSSVSSSSGSSASLPPWDSLGTYEQLAIVCTEFMSQRSVTQIVDTLNADYSAGLNRVAGYKLLQQAVAYGLLKYIPHQAQKLETDIKHKYKWLNSVRVVNTVQFDEVAVSGAEMLIDLLKNFRDPEKKVIRIGFAGGHAMRVLIKRFVKLLSSFEFGTKKTIVFHALVSGFDVHDPTTDPNTFFSLFDSNPSPTIKYKYVGLHAQPLVESDEYDKLIKGYGFKESLEAAKDIDIIVTSATCWGDKHSTFKKYMSKSPESSKVLEEENCIGDMLWHPIGKSKPIDAKTKIRAMTLYDLNGLADFVESGKNVLLVVGPCWKCKTVKSRILKAILEQDRHIITHLVADSRTVKKV